MEFRFRKKTSIGSFSSFIEVLTAMSIPYKTSSPDYACRLLASSLCFAASLFLACHMQTFALRSYTTPCGSPANVRASQLHYSLRVSRKPSALRCFTTPCGFPSNRFLLRFGTSKSFLSACASGSGSRRARGRSACGSLLPTRSCPSATRPCSL